MGWFTEAGEQLAGRESPWMPDATTLSTRAVRGLRTAQTGALGVRSWSIAKSIPRHICFMAVCVLNGTIATAVANPVMEEIQPPLLAL